MTQPDVLVIGGGVVGTACAQALGSQGLAVQVVDDGQAGAATGASAGMLAPFADARAGDSVFALAIRGRDLYCELVPALQAETGIDIGMWTGGILHVAFTQAEADRLKADVAWQRQSGLTSDWLDREHMLQRAPGISREAQGALLAAEDGLVDPQALVQALRTSAVYRGVEFLDGIQVRGLKLSDGRVVGVQTSKGDHLAGAVLIAAGAWSSRIKHLPRPLSVEPIRGQMAAVDWPPGEPTSIAFGPGCYVLRRGNEALIGATMEYVGYESSVTRDGINGLMREAARLYPALAGVTPKRTWAGLRPITPDGRPFIGPDPELQGLWYATGHGRNGVVLAGITGEIIAALYAGQPVEHDLKDVAPARFWRYGHHLK